MFTNRMWHLLCYINIFQQGARLKGSQDCQRALGHTHRLRQCRPGRVQKVGSYLIFQNKVWHMLYLYFSRGVDWEGSQCCKNALGHAY